MAYTDIPFLSYKDTDSLNAILDEFSQAYTSRKMILWLGDSMSTLFGGAGNRRGNALARYFAGVFGSLWQTPLLFARLDTNGQMSVGGTHTNVSNNDARVTSTPEYPPNIDSVQVALGANGVVAVYDPKLLWSTSSTYTTTSIDWHYSRNTKVMPTSGSVTAKVYVTTRPSASGINLEGRTYNAYDAISVFDYASLTTGLSNGQAAAEGHVVAIPYTLTLNLTENQMYAVQTKMTGTVTDYVGTRFVANSVTRGFAFDMIGHGGDDASEWFSHHGDTLETLIDEISNPDLLVLRFQMNDSFAGTYLTTYDTGMRDIIDAARAVRPTLKIVILGSTQCADVTNAARISELCDVARDIAEDYDNVVFVNTLLAYNDATKFDSTLEGVTVSTAWATATSYTAGDLRYTPDGRQWKALANHTSSASIAPPGPYWVEVNRTTVDGIHQTLYANDVETRVVFDRLFAEAAARPISQLDAAMVILNKLTFSTGGDDPALRVDVRQIGGDEDKAGGLSAILTTDGFSSTATTQIAAASGNAAVSITHEQNTIGNG